MDGAGNAFVSVALQPQFDDPAVVFRLAFEQAVPPFVGDGDVDRAGCGPGMSRTPWLEGVPTILRVPLVFGSSAAPHFHSDLVGAIVTRYAVSSSGRSNLPSLSRTRNSEFQTICTKSKESNLDPSRTFSARRTARRIASPDPLTSSQAASSDPLADATHEAGEFSHPIPSSMCTFSCWQAHPGESILRKIRARLSIRIAITLLGVVASGRGQPRRGSRAARLRAQLAYFYHARHSLRPVSATGALAAITGRLRQAISKLLVQSPCASLRRYHPIGRSSWHRKVFRFDLKHIRHAEQAEEIPSFDASRRWLRETARVNASKITEDGSGTGVTWYGPDDNRAASGNIPLYSLSTSRSVEHHAAPTDSHPIGG